MQASCKLSWQQQQQTVSSVTRHVWRAAARVCRQGLSANYASATASTSQGSRPFAHGGTCAGFSNTWHDAQLQQQQLCSPDTVREAEHCWQRRNMMRVEESRSSSVSTDLQLLHST